MLIYTAIFICFRDGAAFDFTDQSVSDLKGVAWQYNITQNLLYVSA